MSNPFQDLKTGDTVYYWFKTKGSAKVQGLSYRGVRKAKVASIGVQTLMLSDESVFDRATGKASFPQEIQEAAGLTTIIIPKRIIKPGKAKW
jgi:hypothetical protein